MENTNIEWTDRTYNPVILKGGGFYCFKVSDGCTNCYAEIMANRVAAMQGNQGEKYTNRKVYPELELKRDMLASWAKKGKPKKNFVSSMTDIFGEFVPDEWIFEILDAMMAAPLQIFQVLTKRAKRMYEKTKEWMQKRFLTEMPRNIWVGVTVEHQQAANERIRWLMMIPAYTRFLSCEPLLGAVKITNKALNYVYGKHCGDDHIGVNWVIVGGESGHKARPMRPIWAKSLRDQCLKAGKDEVAFFFKQWGEWVSEFHPANDHSKQYKESDVFVELCGSDDYLGEYMIRVGKKAAGALLDGVEHKNFPHVKS